MFRICSIYSWLCVVCLVTVKFSCLFTAVAVLAAYVFDGNDATAFFFFLAKPDIENYLEYVDQ